MSCNARGSVTFGAFFGRFTDDYQIGIVYESFFQINELSLYKTNIPLYYHCISIVSHIYFIDSMSLNVN